MASVLFALAPLYLCIVACSACPSFPTPRAVSVRFVVCMLCGACCAVSVMWFVAKNAERRVDGRRPASFRLLSLDGSGGLSTATFVAVVQLHILHCVLDNGYAAAQWIVCPRQTTFVTKEICSTFLFLSFSYDGVALASFHAHWVRSIVPICHRVLGSGS